MYGFPYGRGTRTRTSDVPSPPVGCSVAVSRVPVACGDAVRTRQSSSTLLDAARPCHVAEQLATAEITRAPVAPASLAERGRSSGAPGCLHRSRVRPHLGAGVPAAVLAGGDGAVASHASAARLWDFDFIADDGLRDHGAAAPSPEVDGVLVHTLELPRRRDDVTVANGFPCTSFERTFCDSTTRCLDVPARPHPRSTGCARATRRSTGCALCVLAPRLGPAPAAQRRAGAACATRRGVQPGREQRRAAGARRRSTMPTCLRPEQQVRVRVGERTYFLDYAYPDREVLRRVLRAHDRTATPSAVAYDSDRISDLSRPGWQPLDLHRHERRIAEIVERIRSARIARGGMSTGPRGIVHVMFDCVHPSDRIRTCDVRGSGSGPTVTVAHQMFGFGRRS